MTLLWNHLSMSKPLILAVRDRPALYDPRMPGNRNTPIKEGLWKEIANELDLRETEIETLKNKFKSIKDTYRRRKQEKDALLLLGPEDNHKVPREWAHYDICDSFLRPFVQSNKVIRYNVSSEQECQPPREVVKDVPVVRPSCSSSTPISSNVSPMTPTNVPTKSASKRKLKVGHDDMDALFARFIKDQRTAREDSCYMFGQFVGQSLRELPPQKRALAQIRIQNVLAEVALNKTGLDNYGS